MARVFCNTQACGNQALPVCSSLECYKDLTTKVPPLGKLPQPHPTGVCDQPPARLCWEGCLGLNTTPAGKGLPKDITRARTFTGIGDFLCSHGDGFLPALAWAHIIPPSTPISVPTRGSLSASSALGFGWEAADLQTLTVGFTEPVRVPLPLASVIGSRLST